MVLDLDPNHHGLSDSIVPQAAERLQALDVGLFCTTQFLQCCLIVSPAMVSYAERSKIVLLNGALVWIADLKESLHVKATVAELVGMAMVVVGAITAAVITAEFSSFSMHSKAS